MNIGELSPSQLLRMFKEEAEVAKMKQERKEETAGFFERPIFGEKNMAAINAGLAALNFSKDIQDKVQLNKATSNYGYYKNADGKIVRKLMYEKNPNQNLLNTLFFDKPLQRIESDPEWGTLMVDQGGSPIDREMADPLIKAYKEKVKLEDAVNPSTIQKDVPNNKNQDVKTVEDQGPTIPDGAKPYTLNNEDHYIMPDGSIYNMAGQHVAGESTMPEDKPISVEQKKVDPGPFARKGKLKSGEEVTITSPTLEQFDSLDKWGKFVVMNDMDPSMINNRPDDWKSVMANYYDRKSSVDKELEELKNSSLSQEQIQNNATVNPLENTTLQQTKDLLGMSDNLSNADKDEILANIDPKLLEMKKRVERGRPNKTSFTIDSSQQDLLNKELDVLKSGAKMKVNADGVKVPVFSTKKYGSGGSYAKNLKKTSKPIKNERAYKNVGGNAIENFVGKDENTKNARIKLLDWLFKGK